MIRNLSISAAVLAAVGMAAPAIAETVEINITVAPYSELITATAFGSMTIDDGSDTEMGLPSSAGSVECGASNLAAVRLNTNVSVEAVEVDFLRTRNVRNRDDANWPDATWNGVVDGGWDMQDFARAVGAGDGQILGVYPYATMNDGAGGCNVTWHHDPRHTLGPVGGGRNGFAVRSGGNPNNDGGPFANGTHLIELGVAGNWSNTVIGEDVFAAPQVYTVELTATIMP